MRRRISNTDNFQFCQIWSVTTHIQSHLFVHSEAIQTTDILFERFQWYHIWFTEFTTFPEIAKWRGEGNVFKESMPFPLTLCDAYCYNLRCIFMHTGIWFYWEAKIKMPALLMICDPHPHCFHCTELKMNRVVDVHAKVFMTHL